MASRRLDISSLLCDDSQSAFSPLDVLVHAATEERKRLGAVDEPRHPPPFPQDSKPPLPVNNDHHVVRSPVSSPTLSRYTADDTQRIHPSQQHLYLQRSRTHHDNLPLPEQQQQHRKQSSREIDYSSFQPGHPHRVEPEQRRRVEEQQRIHELEFQRQQDLERAIRAQEFERRRREEDRLRALEHQQREQERREAERLQQYQQRLFLEEHKQRWEAERQREELRQLERAREAERQREIERQQQQQQRHLEAERLREFDRLREAERIQESKRRSSHSSQDVNELQYPQRFPENHSNNSSPVSIPHFTSHPSPDPLQIRRSATSNSPDSSSVPIAPSLRDDLRPVKKRRYSESPSRPMPDDQDRIALERERMLVGELGYGRTDSPVAGTSAAPRRLSTGLNHARKSAAVADLLADKEPGPSLSLLLPSPPQPRDTHRIISPTGRRSPPGSQVGRAKAARKSDEYLASLKEQLAPPPPKELVHSPIPSDTAKVKEEPNIKQEPKSSHQRLRHVSDEIRTPTVDESRPKKAVIKEAPPPQPLPPPSKISPLAPRIKLQDDAHEWFLHQYDEDPSPLPSSRSEPSLMPSSSSLPNTITHAPKSPATSQKALTPITAAVALEQELEGLVSPPSAPSIPTLKVTKQEDSDDMDLAVDLAVTELVETMESDDRKHVGMEVDVEDELLSLVDDRPPPPTQPTHLASTARRTTTASLSVSGSHAHSPGVVKPPPAPQPIHRSLSDHLQPAPPTTASQGLAAPVPSGGSVARQTSARAMSDRDSMPPPTTTAKGGSTKKGPERGDSVVPPEPTLTKTTTGRKKKEVTAKASNAKSKSNSGTGTSAKPKGKPSAKSKKAVAEASSTAGVGSATPPMVPKPTKGATGLKKAGSNSGSRSASVVPGSGVSGGTPVGDVDVVKAEKQEEEEEDFVDDDDDKLYCLCKTRYDENRFMIACDRCDEWYHTQCVKMPDLDVDLVDQFICPSCIEKNPLLNLQTTYKQRCLYGLRHPDADSLKACHKAARGAFSKYCSDECGVKYMQSRIDSWAKKGGKTEKLWDSVKHAEKREGVVICAADAVVKMDEEEESDGGTKRTTLTTVKPNVVRPSRTKAERETERLSILLAPIEKMREDIQRGVEIIVCRERLLQLASERAELVGQCGWDQRLCCDDEELADIGAGMLESYEDTKVEDAADDGADMEVDGGIEQWWCPGKKVCERHAGWQTIRYKDVRKEKEMKEEALAKLTTREREIRKHMEEMLDPHGVNDMKRNKNNGPNVPLKSSTAKVVNGHHAKSKTLSGERKGKKRKAPSA